MLTRFDRPDEGKELYFKLNSSFQIINLDCASPTHKYAGIYAIYSGDVCYYVGQSQNLASRLSQHLMGKYESATRIDCFFVMENGFADFHERSKESKKSILEYNEMAFMDRLKPIENLITPGDEFEIESDKSFHCISSEDEFYSYGFLSVYMDDYYIDVTSGIGSCELTGEAYKEHNEFVVSAYKHFGDDAFNRGII